MLFQECVPLNLPTALNVVAQGRPAGQLWRPPLGAPGSVPSRLCAAWPAAEAHAACFVLHTAALRNYYSAEG